MLVHQLLHLIEMVAISVNSSDLCVCVCVCVYDSALPTSKLLPVTC